jgi:alpha-glucosidase
MTTLPLGNVTRATPTATGLDLQCDHGRVRLTVLSPTLIRVRATQAPDFGPDFSYAIAKTKWPKTACTVTGGVITTKQLRVTVGRQPFGLEFARPDGTRLHRHLGIEWDGARCRSRHELLPAERIFGCGEKTGVFNKRGQALGFWNTDNPSHTYLNSEIYVSIPFFLSSRPGAHYGIFWDNTHRTHFNFGHGAAENETRLESSHGEVDFYFLAGASVPALVREYTELTGRLGLPPRWALGYQQCRWSYLSAAEVLEVAKGFRDRGIPADVMYCDIDYMDGFRVWTWNPKTFAKPRELIRQLAQLNFKLVTIVDPGVKNDDHFPVCRQGKEQGMFIRKPDGQWFTGPVWPGECVFPDFTDPRVRAWWGQWHQDFLDLGVAGFWNDMNEPAVWSAPDGGTMPLDLPQCYEGQWTTHARAHNVYGLTMARASYEGVRQLRPDERPFIITRSAYAGVQRYSMVWTGDNHSTWEQLALSIPQCLNLSLSGVAFCGPDVGGFSWDCTGELLARWTQAGAFFPFFRNHTAQGTRRQEPWTFGAEVERICRDAIRQRYRLLPYLYNLFHEASTTGAPVMRPLFWEFPDDEHGYAVEDQFLLGPALLVAPILKAGARQRAVWLPAGAPWYEWGTNRQQAGGQYVTARAPLDKIPVYVRAGTILPTTADIEHTGAQVKEIVLQVYPGVKTAGYLYEDDGASFAFERGEYSLTKFAWTNGALKTTVVKSGYAGAVPKHRVQLFR